MACEYGRLYCGRILDPETHQPQAIHQYCSSCRIIALESQVAEKEQQLQDLAKQRDALKRDLLRYQKDDREGVGHE